MKFFSITFFLLIIVCCVYPASVNVDELTILADSHFDKNLQAYMVNTYFKFISSFDGGYKFAANVQFEANVTELERSYRENPSDFYNNVFMLFRHAEVKARNLLDSHLSLSFWTGEHKYLGSGNSYHGFMYYPESTDQDYKGFYRVRGTGLTTELKFWQERFKAKFHLYENTNFITSETPDAFYYFSFDAELGLYFEEIPIGNNHFNLLVELISGITFPIAPMPQFKVGLTFGIGSDYVNFFISAGLPKLDAHAALLSFDELFLSADLHFKLFITDHTISFLTRPRWWNEQKYGENGLGEKNDMDVNYRLLFMLPDFPLQWGLIVNFKYSMNSTIDFWNLYVAPFLEITFSGVKWNLTSHYDFSRIYMAQFAASPEKESIYLEGLTVVLSASSKF